MRAAVQIMLLPPAVPDGPPQIFLDEDGIWRDVSDPQNVVKQSAMRATVENHLAVLMARVGGTPPASVVPDQPGFRTPFRNLFTQLLPLDVRQELERVASEADATNGPRPWLKVYFTPVAEWIPWELLHDGRGFLGLRFSVARLPIVRQPTEVRGPRQRQVGQVYSLLARNVLPNGIRGEWDGTFAGFSAANGWEHRYPDGPADNYPTLSQLEEARGADIVHVTCHGGLRDDTQALYWTLDHANPMFFDYRITADFAQSAEFEHRPLIFGNACASAATQPADLGALHGFGASFMIGGALNFVGTFAPVTKTMAVTFARRFYERLFGAGQPALPVADALVSAKQSFAAANCADPSYLFYCLYGPPDSVYTV
jgi:hypothetical protein